MFVMKCSGGCRSSEEKKFLDLFIIAINYISVSVDTVFSYINDNDFTPVDTE